MTTYVNFKLFNGSALLREYVEAACYWAICRTYLEPDTTDIICHHSNDNTPFTPEECAEWVRLMNTWGFKVDYLGNTGNTEYAIAENNHIFRVYVKDATKTYIRSSTEALSVLTIVRYLLESGNFVARKYFELRVDLPKANTFFLMQMAHYHYNFTANHALMNGRNQRQFITLKEIHKRLDEKAANNTLYNNGVDDCGVHKLWTDSPKVVIPDGLTLAQQYSRLASRRRRLTNIYVVGGDKEYANWLPDSKIVKRMRYADVVLFTGGEDVSPELYGEEPHPTTGCNPARDAFEKAEYEKATKLGKKKLGICRGSQFLCVMAGGKLVQHQSNPHRIHEIRLYNGRNIMITSTHHQAAHLLNLSNYRGDYTLIGYTQNMLPFHKGAGDAELHIPNGQEAEIVHYPKAKALGIQGHPEFRDYQAAHPESLVELQTIFKQFIANELY